MAAQYETMSFAELQHLYYDTLHTDNVNFEDAKSLFQIIHNKQVKMEQRKKLLRLLRCIDYHFDNIPEEFISKLTQIITELGQNPSMVTILTTNRDALHRMIQRCDHMVKMDISQIYDNLALRLEMFLRIDEYVDAGIEMELLQNPPNSTLLEKFKEESPEFHDLFCSYVFYEEDEDEKSLDDILEADILKDVQLPVNRALIGARLGDYGLVHQALGDGAKPGMILEKILNLSRVDDSPLYLLNGPDRKLLQDEMIQLVKDEQSPGSEFFIVEKSGVGVLYQNINGTAYEIGDYDFE